MLAAFLGSSPTCIATLLLDYKQNRKCYSEQNRWVGGVKTLTLNMMGEVLRKLVEDDEIGTTNYDSIFHRLIDT